MKKIMNAKIQILMIFVFGLNACFAQSDYSPAATTKKNEIENKISGFNTALLAYETKTKTNGLELDNHSFNELMGLSQHLKDAMTALDRSNSSLNRQQRAILWMEILSAIETNLDSSFLTTNLSPVSINGYIPPPQGYKGKIGLYGMLPPDTNDVADYSYYVSEKRKINEARLKVDTLQSMKNLNQEANAHIEMFIRANYSSSDSDKQEFDEIIKNTQLSAYRQEQLKRTFEKSHQ